MNGSLPEGAIEALFDQMATAIDGVGEAQESLFLVKLVLLMAAEIGDPDRITALIAEARNSLDD